MEIFYGKVLNYQRVSDGIIILPRSPPLQVSFNLLGLHSVTAMVQLEFDHLLDTMVASLQLQALQGPGIEGVALTEANLRKLNDQRRLRRPSTSSRLHWWNMIDKKNPYRIHVFRQICIVFVLCVCFFEELSWHRFLNDYWIGGTISMFAIVFCSTVFGTKPLVS